MEIITRGFRYALLIVCVLLPNALCIGSSTRRNTHPTPYSTSIPTPVPTPTLISNREAESVADINARRSLEGLGILTINPLLTKVGFLHSYDIGVANVCSHTGSDGSSPGSRLLSVGYTGLWGEVVGCRYKTPTKVIQAFWDSPAHHAILTNPNYSEIGCGWWVNPYGYGWVTCDLGIQVKN